MTLKGRAITIAIDGFSACGKSTLARSLAKALHYVYIDSGAMYRALTWYCIQLGIEPSDVHRVTHALEEINLTFQLKNGQNCISVNGQILHEELRSLAVNDRVSYFAEIPLVRKKLVALQQKYGTDGGVVMDGRDIGTVVFPDAEIKFFVVADFEVRAKRRLAEADEQFPGKYTLEQIRENLALRDKIDSTRADSPLTQTQDAIVIDTTNNSAEESLARALQYVESISALSK